MHLWYALSVSQSGGLSSLITALGIDWRSLILDAIGFFITMAILAKFVYPVLIKALDSKQGELEAAARLEHQAKEELAKAQDEIHSLISKARGTAEDIITTAKTEASELAQASSDKAAAHAERIVSEAHDQLERDIRVAREALKADTARLVASATETLLQEKLNDSSDARLVTKSLETLERNRS